MVGISALVHRGINAYVLCIVRDPTHHKFIDSFIGGIVAPLSNGLILFNYYPNFSVYAFDEHLMDILKLQIKTACFDMSQVN